jgi:hypothetical protein
MATTEQKMTMTDGATRDAKREFLFKGTPEKPVDHIR